MIGHPPLHITFNLKRGICLNISPTDSMQNQ